MVKEPRRCLLCSLARCSFALACLGLTLFVLSWSPFNVLPGFLSCLCLPSSAGDRSLSSSAVGVNFRPVLINRKLDYAALPLHRGAPQQRMTLVPCASPYRWTECGLENLQMAGARNPQTGDGRKAHERPLGLDSLLSTQRTPAFYLSVHCLLSSLITAGFPSWYLDDL